MLGGGGGGARHDQWMRIEETAFRHAEWLRACSTNSCGQPIKADPPAWRLCAGPNRPSK